MLSPRDAAFIGCRLLALFLVFQIDDWIPAAQSLVLRALALIEGAAATPVSGNLATFAAIALQLLLQLAPALVLWFGATWFSRRIYPTAVSEAVEGYWDRKAVLSVAVTAFGLFVLILSLPGLLNLFWVTHGLSPITSIFNFDALFSVIFGIVCIVGSDSIAQFVVKLRRW